MVFCGLRMPLWVKISSLLWLVRYVLEEIFQSFSLSYGATGHCPISESCTRKNSSKMLLDIGLLMMNEEIQKKAVMMSIKKTITLNQ